MGKLGYSSITLTDLTETLPMSLVLENTSGYTTQTKTGELYIPNFKEKELIITPSLFRGNEEIDIKENSELLAELKYEINIGEEEQIVSYGNPLNEIIDGQTLIIAEVDNNGVLHYKKNLIANLTIEALISKYVDSVHNIEHEQIFSSNSLSILFLEHGNNAYVPVIESGGREHFEEANQTDITLTAKLYYNGRPIDEENLEFLWDKVSDVDDGSNEDFSATTPSISVQRKSVGSTQIYSCRITDKKTKIEYVVSKIIRDFTDLYNSVLIASDTLILTPQKPTVSLTCQVWQGTTEIKDGNITYEWFLLTENSEQDKRLEETASFLQIDTSLSQNIFPQENFTILCKATRYGSVSLAYANIIYSSIDYTVEISPSSIFLPSTNDGVLKGEESIKKEFSFRLVNKNNQALKYDSNSSFVPQGDNFSILSKKDGYWDFTLSLEITKDDSFWTSKEDTKIYEFSYKYFNNTFTEQIQVIKNYIGAEGIPGEQGTGYSILLTNEALTIPGTVEHSVEGITRETKILSFINTVETPATLTRVGETSVSGDVNGLPITINGVTYFNIDINNNGTSEVVLSLTTTDKIGKDGLSLPLYFTIDDKTFVKYLSISVAFKGLTGAPGNSYQIKPTPTVVIYKISNGIGSFVDVNGEIISEMKAAAYYYNETSTTSQVFSNGYFHFYGAVQAGDWTLISESNAASSSFSYTQITNLLSYRFFKYQLTNRDGSIIYDEQSISVLREGYLYGGQNLLLDSGKTIEISAETGVQEGVFYLIPSLNKNILFGQDLTLSFERYLPKGTRNKIDASESAVFGMWFVCEYTWSDGSSEIIQQIQYLLEDLNYTNISDKNKELERVSGTINLVKPSSFRSGGKEYTLLNNFDCWVQYKMNYYTTYSGTGTSTNEDEDTDTNAHLSYPKLETGIEPTAWSPAQEDISFGTIQGTNLIESSYKKIVDNGNNLLSVVLQQVGDYTLSWKEIEGIALISNEDISLSVTIDSSSVNFLSFKNTKAGSELIIRPVSDTGSVVFTQIKLQKGSSATSWLLSDSDIQAIIQEVSSAANQYTDGKLDKNSLIKILGLNGEMLSISAENWENIKSVTSTVVGADNGAALSSFLQGYTNLGKTSEGNYIFSEVMSRIILNYDEYGTPYLQLSVETGEQMNYYMRLTNEKLGFYEKTATSEKELAYFSSSRLYVSSITAYRDIIFGQASTGGIIFTAGQTGIGISRISINDSRFPILE